MDANEYRHYVQRRYYYELFEHVARVFGNGNLTLVMSLLLSRHEQFTKAHGDPDSFTLKYEYIENATGLNKKTVQRAINKLDKCGVIDKEATAVRNKGQDSAAPYIKKTKFTINYEMLVQAYTEDKYANKIYTKDIKSYMEKCPTIAKIRANL